MTAKLNAMTARQVSKKPPTDTSNSSLSHRRSPGPPHFKEQRCEAIGRERGGTQKKAPLTIRKTNQTKSRELVCSSLEEKEPPMPSYSLTRRPKPNQPEGLRRSTLFKKYDQLYPTRPKLQYQELNWCNHTTGLRISAATGLYSIVAYVRTDRHPNHTCIVTQCTIVSGASYTVLCIQNV